PERDRTQPWPASCSPRNHGGDRRTDACVGIRSSALRVRTSKTAPRAWSDRMILPTVRASFGRRDALHLVDLLARRDPELREAARARLEEAGPDSLLDDPRVRNALLTDPDVQAPPSLVFYVLVRQALLEGGIDSAAIADL